MFKPPFLGRVIAPHLAEQASGLSRLVYEEVALRVVRGTRSEDTASDARAGVAVRIGYAIVRPGVDDERASVLVEERRIAREKRGVTGDGGHVCRAVVAYG